MSMWQCNHYTHFGLSLEGNFEGWLSVSVVLQERKIDKFLAVASLVAELQ